MAAQNWKTLAFAAFIGLMLNAPGTFGQTKQRMTAVGELSGALESAAQVVTPAVVEIFATSYVPVPGLVPTSADLLRTQRASGSGVIVDPEGYIVTNAHVVSGAQRLRVELSIPPNGRSILAAASRTVTAQIVGLDLESHLLPLIQRLQAGSGDCGHVHEDVAPAVIRLDEAVTLVRIEEFHHTLLRHASRSDWAGPRARRRLRGPPAQTYARGLGRPCRLSHPVRGGIHPHLRSEGSRAYAFN